MDFHFESFPEFFRLCFLLFLRSVHIFMIFEVEWRSNCGLAKWSKKIKWFCGVKFFSLILKWSEKTVFDQKIALASGFLFLCGNLTYCCLLLFLFFGSDFVSNWFSQYIHSSF